MNKVTALTAAYGLLALLLADFTQDTKQAAWLMIGGMTLVAAAVVRLVLERLRS